MLRKVILYIGSYKIVFVLMSVTIVHKKLKKCNYVFDNMKIIPKNVIISKKCNSFILIFNKTFFTFVPTVLT